MWKTYILSWKPGRTGTSAVSRIVEDDRNVNGKMLFVVIVDLDDSKDDVDDDVS